MTALTYHEGKNAPLAGRDLKHSQSYISSMTSGKQVGWVAWERRGLWDQKVLGAKTKLQCNPHVNGRNPKTIDFGGRKLGRTGEKKEGGGGEQGKSRVSDSTWKQASNVI